MASLSSFWETQKEEGPVQGGWEGALVGIPESITGRTPRSCRKCLLRINGGLNAECRLFPSSSTLESLLFLFKDQCAIYFSLKVHLLNPQCLSSKTVLHRVINPHGVPLKVNDIL